MRIFATLLFSLLLISNKSTAQKESFYTYYHQKTIEAEELIVVEKYDEALSVYEKIFSTHDFIFVREYKIATQLALHLQKIDKSFQYLKLAIAVGWKMKSIKKNQFLSPLRNDPQWKLVSSNYKSMVAQYERKINHELRKEVKKMFAKDQRLAFGALFAFSSKAQDRYAEKRFAPNSDKQVQRLIQIVDELGYPGEKLIGNKYWASTILSHHNSISQEFNKRDTLYQFIKPKLFEAIDHGEMSPYELGSIDDWYLAVVSGTERAGYGYLNQPTAATLLETNELRAEVGLRSIELRNRLLELEMKTGMNFYLPE